MARREMGWWGFVWLGEWGFGDVMATPYKDSKIKNKLKVFGYIYEKNSCGKACGRLPFIWMNGT
jgi:hypothetical protein